MPPKRSAEAVRRSSRRTSNKSQYFEASETEESDPPPKKRRGRPPKEQAKREPSEDVYEEEPVKEPEEENDDDDDEDDEDAPPKVTIIPLEKLRDTDGVDYEDFKPHFSAAWSRTGRKGPYACYYIHCEPKKSFIGGGLWCPDAGQIQKLRASIDERPNRWRRVLNDQDLKRVFLPKAASKSDPESALLAFAEKNKSNALKTKPKGFVAEHRDIELLKLRNFTIGTQIDDYILSADDAQEKISDIIRPMITFLNSIVMPDPGADDDSDDDGDDDGDGDGEDNGSDGSDSE
ncbi:hypothetical protein LRP88_13342 [Fusarium phalaenopsidis]